MFDLNIDYRFTWRDGDRETVEVWTVLEQEGTVVKGKNGFGEVKMINTAHPTFFEAAELPRSEDGAKYTFVLPEKEAGE